MLQMVRIISTRTVASFPSSPSSHFAPPEPAMLRECFHRQQGCAGWAELDRGLGDAMVMAMVMGDSDGDSSVVV